MGNQSNNTAGMKQAQQLNTRLSSTFIAADLKMYDFGGRNLVAPLPHTLNLNGKEVQPYIVVFEEEDGEEDTKRDVTNS